MMCRCADNKNDKIMQQENLIVNLTFKFALDIIVYCELLEAGRKYNMANQLFRSGTSIGANVNEAQAAQSTKDFLAKMHIASKEARETKYWLDLLAATGYINTDDEIIAVMFRDCESIVKILASILLTIKQKEV